MIVRKGFAAVGLVAAVAAVTTVADAATTTGTLVGSACHSIYDNAWVQGTQIFHNTNGVSTTDTVNAKLFTCPIQRVNGLSATGLQGSWVDLYESSTGNQSWCQVMAYDEFGNTVASNSPRFSGGTGQREISLGALSTSDVWGFYSIFCALMPRPSGAVTPQIYSYEWQER